MVDTLLFNEGTGDNKGNDTSIFDKSILSILNGGVLGHISITFFLRESEKEEIKYKVSLFIIDT